MTTTQPRSYHRHILQSLLRREYRTHRALVAQLLAAWLIAIVIVPVIAGATALAVYGVFAAVRLGNALGGQDIVGGYEETVFTAPPSASWRYLVRGLGGLGLLLALLLGGSLAIALQLPQGCWGLIVDSGLTEPPALTPWSSWFAVCGICGSLFTLTFAISASAGTATVARSASVMACGALTSVAIVSHLLVGRWCPDLSPFWGAAIAVGLCCALGAAVVPLGLLVYQRKQVTSSAVAPPLSLAWVMIIVVVLALVLAAGTASVHS